MEGRPPLSVEMFSRMALKQMTLIEEMQKVMKDINSIKPRFRINSIDKIDSKLGLFQDEALKLDRLTDHPDSLLEGDKEMEEIKKNPLIRYEFQQFMLGGQLALGRARIFTLLEHIEKRISGKKEAIYFNRTLGLSFVAIILVLISIVVSIVLNA